MNRRYDVIVLGSGVGGACLAGILARHGKRVLLLERRSHPRFALGESVVPEFSLRAKLLADAFDLPELGYMGNFRELTRHVSLRTGIKRNFTFLHHTEDREHQREHTSQFQAMTHPLGPDAHVYRADLDDWLKGVAIQKGAEYVERVDVQSVEVEDNLVRIHTTDEAYEADFVVDASGRDGALARHHRDAAPELETDTRSLFTHMVGVNPVEEGASRLPVPSPPDQGTLHHVFDGGWFWIIPFGNHKGSSYDQTSVGLTLDRRRFGDSEASAEGEFWSFVRRFPKVERQLSGARAVRPWIKTGRVQYTSRQVAGDRWCLLPHAAGFVDALFSGGLAITLAGVHETARSLLRDPRPGERRFDRLGELTHHNQRFLDQIVRGAFVSFRSHGLFDAWYRIWAVANYHASLGLVRTWLKLRSGDRSAVEEVHEDPYRRVLGSGHPRIRALVEDGVAELDRLVAGEADEESTTRSLFELLGAQEWIPPQFHIADPRRRHLASFSFFPMVAMILWGKRNTPEDIRRHYYDVPATYFSEVGRFLGGELIGGLAEKGRRIRDAFWSRSPA